MAKKAPIIDPIMSPIAINIQFISVPIISVDTIAISIPNDEMKFPFRAVFG
jgi:hypothetical protein